MAEQLKFKDIFYKDHNSCIVTNLPKYLLGIYAIELIKHIEPTRVNSDVGYMYALEHGDTLKANTNWESYTAKNHKSIASEIIFQTLEMINLLIDPFVNPTVDTDNVFTIKLPTEVARTLAHEDLTDPNVMNTLELSVRNLHQREDWCSESVTSYAQLTMTQVIKCFDPLLKKCRFKNLSEEKLLKDFGRDKLHTIGIWLSCLYRLFYTFKHDYWDTFDDLLNSNIICPMAITKARHVPVSEPEVAIGITSDKRYSIAPLAPNRSDYLSLSDRYLILLYNHTV